jgi:hypothetical protein
MDHLCVLSPPHTRNSGPWEGFQTLPPITSQKSESGYRCHRLSFMVPKIYNANFCLTWHCLLVPPLVSCLSAPIWTCPFPFCPLWATPVRLAPLCTRSCAVLDWIYNSPNIHPNFQVDSKFWFLSHVSPSTCQGEELAEIMYHTWAHGWLIKLDEWDWAKF